MNSLTGCPICSDMSIPTDGPFVHCCELPGGRREFVGYADGQVFNFGPDCTAVASELQAHVDNLRREADADTRDMLADYHAALLNPALSICEVCDGDGRVPADGCGELSGGWSNICDVCDGEGKCLLINPLPLSTDADLETSDALADAVMSIATLFGECERCPGTGLADCGAVLDAPGYCARCQAVLDRVFADVLLHDAPIDALDTCPCGAPAAIYGLCAPCFTKHASVMWHTPPHEILDAYRAACGWSCVELEAQAVSQVGKVAV